MATDWTQTGKIVAQKRIAAGLTQFKLADQLGISVRMLSELERGLVRRASATLMDTVRGYLGGEPPELGELRPVPPLPPLLPRRTDVAEAKRQFVLVATLAPRFWQGIVIQLTEHLMCLTALHGKRSQPPMVVRTSRRRRLIHHS